MKEIHVLVLDDEENILNSLKRLFAGEPFGIATTTDDKEAMAVLAKEKIKVVISDERMPNISGVEFLKKVRDAYPDIIRILFTGYADINAAEDAINISQVYRFINKPWNSSEFKTAVHQAVQHYDLVMQNRDLFEATKAKKEELEIANRKLKAMYELQKEFTSTVSHELRTPLASIQAAIDIVISGTAGSLTKDQSNFLAKAKESVGRLNRLITDILDLTKMESGKAQLNLQFNDLNKVINEVVEIQGSVAKKGGLYLKASLDPGLPKIPFDADKINQVLYNFINNAVKFTEKGGIIVVSKNNTEQNHVEVCIRDTGPGIKQEDIPKLFQKFQQLGDPAKRTAGTGLGLAICKEIIAQHSGKVWVESQSGHGSSFYFTLPIEERRK